MSSLTEYAILGHNIVDGHVSKSLGISLPNDEMQELKKCGLKLTDFRSELAILSACTALYVFMLHAQSSDLKKGFEYFIHKKKSFLEFGFNELCKEIDKKSEFYIDIISRHLQPPELPGELNLTLPNWFMEMLKLRANSTANEALLLLSMKYTQIVFWGVFNATKSNLENFDSSKKS